MSYNPCFECLNRYGHDHCKECDGYCLYAKDVRSYKQKIERVLDKMEQWQKVYKESGDKKTASIIEGILNSTKAIFEQ